MVALASRRGRHAGDPSDADCDHFRERRKSMGPAIIDVTEQKRLNDAREAQIPWKKWGPYLSERQWGTVREDYSDNGDAWNYFTHDQARSRAYKWGEDGLGGLCDASVLRAGVVERARPDPEGAHVRAHQQRREP